MTSAAGGSSFEFLPGCVHTKLARFQDDFGSQKCSVCNQAPEFGIIYQCVPEVIGDFADAELLDLEDEMRKYNIGQRLSCASGDSMSTIMSDLTRYNSAGAPPTASISREELSLFHASKAHTRRSTTAVCNFKICQGCLPVYRGRAWPLPDDTVDGISLPPPTRRGMDIQPRADTPRVIPGMNFHPEFRFYQQIPPHLVDDYRSPSISTTNTTMEDEYFTNNNVSERTYAGRRFVSGTARSPVGMSNLDVSTGADHKVVDLELIRRAEEKQQGEGYEEEEEHGEEEHEACAPPIAIYAQNPELVRPRLRRTSLTPPPSPPPKDWQALPASMTGSGSTTSSRVRGRYFDDATMKAMQELERKMDAVVDLDEDSREKRAGRRLSQGRFFID